jgi:hypothetical protein
MNSFGNNSSNNDSEVTVSDINNLQNLQQQRSSQKLRIKIDPTITNVGDIELTSHNYSDSDDHTPDIPLGITNTENIIEQDKLTFTQHDSSINQNKSAQNTYRSNNEGESAQNTYRSNQDGTNQERRPSIKIPSTYVQERLKNLDNQVTTSRRKRNTKYYQNCILTWIRNITIFYILFIIGFALIYLFTDIFVYNANNANNTNCTCIGSGTGDSIINHTYSDTKVNNIQYLPIPPKFWQQQLSNLTETVTIMIDDYFATKGIEYISNSSNLITNETIKLLQTVHLSKIMVDNIINNQIITSSIISNNASIDTITNDIMISNIFTTSNATVLDTTLSNKIDASDIETNNIETALITTSNINANDIKTTKINAEFINSQILYSDLLNTTTIIGENISSIIVNAINVIATNVESIGLFGNKLNKCTVGKC